MSGTYAEGDAPRLLIATSSAHKLGELRALLDLPGVEMVSLRDVGITEEAPEDADTFRENAIFKAHFYATRSGLPTLADDSGLEVDALGGGPGVRTKRYAGEDATDADNNAKLLRELEGVAPERRTARYCCSLAFAEPGADDVAPPGAPAEHAGDIVASGTLEGRIALMPRGDGGFGYDPLFEPATEPAGGRTVGELTPEEKNAISHRANAARAMAPLLRQRGW